MQPTTSGCNRTGVALFADDAESMADAVMRCTPPAHIDTTDSDRDRTRYIAEAPPVGSIPPPASLRGSLKIGLGKFKGWRPEVLMDKIGERMAHERSGTRLYEALILKYKATREAGEGLPPLSRALTSHVEPTSPTTSHEDPLLTLERIRAEELAHFCLLCEAMEQVGGDPSAMTPCACVASTASAGILQVVADPRTTLAQCLAAILTAELADTAGWELLVRLAEQAGETELSKRFLDALSEEMEHVDVVRNWLGAVVTSGKVSVLV